VRFVPHGLRSALPELKVRLSGVLAVTLVLLPLSAGAQQQPPPMPRSTAAPTTPQHAEYTVEVNRKGQVIRVRSAKHASDPSFDARIYGNALQVFIRRPDGTALAGVYLLTYDYNPRTKQVTRHVALVQPGGVNPDALGAVDVLGQQNAKALHPTKTPPPASPLPDFSAIIQKK
jgi:hypothetical protein